MLPFSPHLPFPKQATFLDLADTRELFFGGAAGGGKSDVLLMDALRYVKVPGYAALILRRTLQDLALPDAIMSRAHAWLAGSGARWIERDKTYSFPTTGAPATISFGYLEHESDKFRYQGAQLQRCVARGTPILMGDDTWKAIETVQVGDVVATLLGPRAVTHTFSLGRKPVVKVSGPYGSAVVSETHRLLTGGGTWASPRELKPTVCRAAGTEPGASAEISAAAGTPAACSPSGLPPIHALSPRCPSETSLLGFGALTAACRSGCEASGDSLPGTPPPEEWYAPLTLFAPALRSADPALTAGSWRACSSAHCATSGTGCSGGCRAGGDSGGEPSRSAPEGAQARIPSPVGAAERYEPCWREDGLGCTPRRTPSAQPALTHPYTNKPMVAVVETRTTWARMAPAGEEEVFDLRVAEASHYVTWGGIIAQNCYFDELTQFTKTQYTYLLSRIRRPAWMADKVPLGARSAANPGGDGHAWVMERFIEGAVNEKGEVWREDDLKKPPLMASLWWRRSEEIIHDDGTVGHADRYFIPSLLEDNPALDAAYNVQLQELDPVTRAQLRRGDWSIKATGNMFKPEWFKTVDALPRTYSVRRHRYWDCAAGEVKAGSNPDFSIGALVALVNGDWYVEDIVRGRFRPRELEDIVLETAERDGRRVEITMEQEPGASGVQVIDHYSRKLVGYAFRGDKKGYKKAASEGATATNQRQTKVELAKPFSAAAERGRVHLLRASWNRHVIEEAMAFPHGAHDDIIDAIGGAMRQLAARVAPSWEGIPAMGSELKKPVGLDYSRLHGDPDDRGSILKRRM